MEAAMPRKPKTTEKAQAVPTPLDFRPESYWPGDSLRLALLGNIKGEVRRRILKESLESGDEDIPPAEILAPSLDPTMRRLLGRIHPMFMGGEYLPDYEAAEVEIARVAFQSTTGDVISVRALPDKDGWICYRIVDEYETEFTLPITRSMQPLTLAELIQTIDESDGQDHGQVLPFLKMNAENDDPNNLWDFITVSSDFYPGLTSHYEQVCRECLEKYIEPEETES
jgi:hypothetical protein